MELEYILEINPTPKDSVSKSGEYECIIEVEKFNPYHDAHGRFTTADGANFFTIRTKDPSKQYLSDNAVIRELFNKGLLSFPLKLENELEIENQGSRLKTLQAVESVIAKQDYESAAVVDGEGHIVLSKDGEKDAVNFSFIEVFAMRDKTLTHNHPGASMFSPDDIGVFSYNKLAAIRVVNREGTVYCLEADTKVTRKQREQFFYAYRDAFYEAGMQSKSIDEEGIGRSVTDAMEKWCKEQAGRFGMIFKKEKNNIKKSGITPPRRRSRIEQIFFGVTIDRDWNQFIKDLATERARAKYPGH